MAWRPASLISRAWLPRAPPAAPLRRAGLRHAMHGRNGRPRGSRTRVRPLQKYAATMRPTISSRLSRAFALPQCMSTRWGHSLLRLLSSSRWPYRPTAACRPGRRTAPPLPPGRRRSRRVECGEPLSPPPHPSSCRPCAALDSGQNLRKAGARPVAGNLPPTGQGAVTGCPASAPPAAAGGRKSRSAWLYRAAAGPAPHASTHYRCPDRA